MRGLSPSLSVKFLLAALFLWVQGAAMFDAAAHGEQPHKHYGVSCELTKAVSAEVALLPAAPALPKPPRDFVRTEQPTLDFRPWSHPPGRAPPPRSPPHTDQ
ncbi:hypothetical protein [Henriciella aquimarina]|uniref:hypothetical protein n=1 Tax=Henriciella aquimarina TaxID=545261 RepID=UPI0009FBB872|nr:hypothetical protein [Henriciella aquimarina]